MTNTTTTSPITNQELDRDSLKAAIRACLPFEYLDDLKRRVAEHLGNPELNAPFSGKDSFGYRVYCLEKEVKQEDTAARLGALDFFLPTTEQLAKLENTPVEMIFGVNSIFGGERIKPGRIKSDGRGGFLFLPKGNRTKGFFPGYLRRTS